MWARIGSLFTYSLTPSKCKPGVGSGEAGVGWGVGGGGGEGVGGVGTHWQPSNTF